jgi:hypothetical protein
MPAYPAFARWHGSAMAAGGAWVRWGLRAVAAVTAAAAAAISVLLYLVRGMPTPGDISNALARSENVYEVYTLSLGHMGDLTIRSFAYLRLPLVVAGIALLLGAVCSWRWNDRRAFLGLALMMALFAHAARIAMVTFDPYLSSRPLAEALRRAPQGTLIVDDQYYAFSSNAMRDLSVLLNGRDESRVRLNAPTPRMCSSMTSVSVFSGPEWRYYLGPADGAARIERLAGRDGLHTVAKGGKLLQNQPILSSNFYTIQSACRYRRHSSVVAERRRQICLFNWIVSLRRGWDGD